MSQGCLLPPSLPCYSAFTTLSCQASVDHILGLLFDTVLSQCSLTPGSPLTPAGSPLTPSSPLLGVPAFPRLKLPTDTTVSPGTPYSVHFDHTY